ncbi:hypothetical protein T02_12525, partial [Trichinella nativa]
MQYSIQLGIISRDFAYWTPTVGRSSGKLRRSLAISVWFGISQRVRKNWILFMTAIKVATVVDPVGIRAI